MFCQENIGSACILKWFLLEVAKSQVSASLIHLQLIFEQSKRWCLLFLSRGRVPGMQCRLCPAPSALSSSSCSLAVASRLGSQCLFSGFPRFSCLLHFSHSQSHKCETSDSPSAHVLLYFFISIMIVGFVI